MIRNLAVIAFALLTFLGCADKKAEYPDVPQCVITRNRILQVLHTGAKVGLADVEALNACYPKLGNPQMDPVLINLEAAMIKQLEAQEAREIELVKALGGMKNPNSIPVLLEVMSISPFVRVRIEAARSLGKIGGPSAKLALLRWMSVESAPEVIKAIQEAINVIDAVLGPQSSTT